MKGNIESKGYEVPEIPNANDRKIEGINEDAEKKFDSLMDDPIDDLKLQDPAHKEERLTDVEELPHVGQEELSEEAAKDKFDSLMGDDIYEGVEENNEDDIDEPLSYEEQVAKQEEEIKAVESGEKEFDKTNTHETGNYGEMKTDQDLRSKGYERISGDMVTDIDDKTHQGLDGVYYNPNGHPQYIIVDSKYGSSQLGETQDGKQMSEAWIDARLEKDLGPEQADEIRMAKLQDPDNVGAYVAHVDSEGNVTYDKLDANANVVEKDVDING